MKQKFIHYYMKVANETAKLSYATRLQVGTVIVMPDGTMTTGYNGTPEGWDNTCESPEWMESDAGMWLDAEDIEEQWPFKGHRPDLDREMRYKLVTKPEVLHSEMNALMKIAKSTLSTKDAVLFCTHAPCMDCAKAIYQAGIKTVYYENTYRSTKGIEFLKNGGIVVNQYTRE